jgi:hypothetical protein
MSLQWLLSAPSMLVPYFLTMQIQPINISFIKKTLITTIAPWSLRKAGLRI